MRLAENNLPVGLDRTATFFSSDLQIQPGTRILLGTDGITETRDANREFFGEDRVAEAFGRYRSLDAILEEVEAFAGSQPAEDDCTIVELRYTSLICSEDI